jgi:mannose-1-phosphate guanylyltransferase / phosphomannomutase
MKLVIIAGGKGTRLGLQNIPKPMVELNEKPLLEHQILLAKRYNINDIYILSGHLSDVIVDYFQDGKKWDVNITHIIEDKPLSTAGALKQLENILLDRFMVFYGDTIMDVDLKLFMEFDATKKDSIGSIIVHPNDHPHDSDLLEIDDGYKVIEVYSKPHKNNIYYANLVNASLYILSPKIFEYIEKDVKLDFGRDIFLRIIKTENLFAYKTTEYLKDMGTPERFKKTKEDFFSGKVTKLNKSYPQKAIFLDRDGVINKEVDNLSNIDRFELIDGVIESIKLINESEFICIVVTNQPVIAKGFLTEKELKLIHNKMDTILGTYGAYLDALYYCPHHPERGFVGEIPKLKVVCKCRKPSNGMLMQASQKYNIDLSRSWMIGDRYVDVKAGKNSNCKTILLQTGHSGNDKNKFNIKPDYICKNLEKAIALILSEELKNDNY